jgi:hypothetical protein
VSLAKKWFSKTDSPRSDPVSRWAVEIGGQLLKTTTGIAREKVESGVADRRSVGYERPFEPASFTVSMTRKEVQLMVDKAAEHGCPLVVMPTVAAQ